MQKYLEVPMQIAVVAVGRVWEASAEAFHQPAEHVALGLCQPETL